jgi:predicted SnoaL-like aldol condensation-catalyzing enzyme
MRPWVHAVSALAGIAAAVSFEAWTTSPYGPRSGAHYAGVENASMTPREVVLGFDHLALNEGKPREAVTRYVAAQFIDHQDTHAGGDARESLIARLSERQASDPQAKRTIERVVVEGDIVVIYSRGDATDGGPISGVDIFRVQDRKIAEHWSVYQRGAEMT